jgi:hypothetical protein
MKKHTQTLINSALIAFLFCFFQLLPMLSNAQIRERQETKPVTPTRPSASATTVPVEVRWEGSNTVNIVIDGTAYAFRGGQMQLLKVKPNATLELYVQVPGKKIYAEEFLLIEPDGGFLEVKLNGDSAVFQYETPSERSLRERREVERQQAERIRLEELEREEASKREEAAKREVEKKTQTNRSDMTAEKVLENYLSAIGGADKVAAIKTAKISMDAKIMVGMKFIFIYDSENERFIQKNYMGRNVISKISLEDGKAYSSFREQITELTGADLANLKLNYNLFPELVYKENGYTLTLDGLKDVDGTPAYKVIIASASGAKLINYYAAKSGLKIKNENPASGDTFYSDYKVKDGILLPMAWTIKSPQIPVPFETKVTSMELNLPITAEDIN